MQRHFRSPPQRFTTSPPQRSPPQRFTTSPPQRSPPQRSPRSPPQRSPPQRSPPLQMWGSDQDSQGYGTTGTTYDSRHLEEESLGEKFWDAPKTVKSAILQRTLSHTEHADALFKLLQLSTNGDTLVYNHFSSPHNTVFRYCQRNNGKLEHGEKTIDNSLFKEIKEKWERRIIIGNTKKLRVHATGGGAAAAASVVKRKYDDNMSLEKESVEKKLRDFDWNREDEALLLRRTLSHTNHADALFELLQLSTDGDTLIYNHVSSPPNTVIKYCRRNNGMLEHVEKTIDTSLFNAIKREWEHDIIVGNIHRDDL